MPKVTQRELDLGWCYWTAESEVLSLLHSGPGQEVAWM